jgi:protein-S-isoprenylcysteine O-methyltransferase Ste14
MAMSMFNAKVHTKLVNIKPPQVAALLTAVSVALHYALPKEYRLDFACPAASAFTFALGFAISTWAIWLFRRKGTPVVPSDRVISLVTSGPFRFSRNPMYLGVTVMLFAVTLWFGTWPILIAPAGFWGFMSLVRIPYEEALLHKIFGEAYVSYAKKVRRWI